MKKKGLLQAFVFVIGIAFVIWFLPSIHGIDAQDSLGDIKDKIDTLPKDTEQIKDDYLKKEWATIIAQNKLLGPPHAFFLTHQLPFTFLFAEPYSVSLIFPSIVLLWLFVIYLIAKPLKAAELINSNVAFIVSIGCAIILAHMGVIKTFVLFILELVLSKKEWYTRIILGIIVVLALFVARTLDHYFAHYIRKTVALKKEHTQESTTKQTKEKLRALERGLKEGAALSKKLNRP